MLLQALCDIGPSEDNWCRVYEDVVSGTRDPAATMRWVFDRTDPACSLRPGTMSAAHDGAHGPGP